MKESDKYCLAIFKVVKTIRGRKKQPDKENVVEDIAKNTGLSQAEVKNI